MYAGEYAEDDQNNERERRERRRKKHRKSRDVNQNDDELYAGNANAEFDIEPRMQDSNFRRSEEENYEPVTETKRKHRHRRSRTEDVDYPDEGNVGIGVRDEEDPMTIEEQEEARRQRREKKKRARERKKSQEEPYLQSPQSEVNNYPFEAEPDNYNLDDDVNYQDQDQVSVQEDEVDLPETPPPEEPKPKKKSGGFGKLFASFKKKNKAPKAEGQVNAQWESNPEIFNPAYDSQPGTLEKQKKKFAGKSGRDIVGRNVHVILLDGEEVEMNIDLKSTGTILFDQVCQELDLIEKDFFGMTYVNAKLQTWFWLDMEKKIAKQLGKDDDWTFNFQVKFYPPEPVLLQEDITRYLLSLQVRQDVYTGKLPCSWITQALLGSFMVQSELGDYDELENGDGIDYLREFEFVLNQSEQLLEKICELHKKHVGMSPDKADIKYLETAKRLEQYGVDLHPARDNDDVEIFIGVSFQGILIYRDRMRIGRFAWPKVLRISYKKNYFYLKIRSDRYDDSVAIVGFKLLNHNLAKRLWKNAAEQHTFFRMKEPQMGKQGPKLIPTTGSNVGYKGKTLHQYRTMNINRTQPAHFDRSLNKRRTIGSMPAGLNSAGMQYSSMHSLNRAHPRDMTLGKTKSVEHLSSRKPAGSMSALAQDREGSIGSFSQSRKGPQQQQPLYPPYGSISSYKNSDHRQSFHSGDSLNGGDSYMVNHDDQLSLPPMSPNIPHQEYAKPTKKHRSKPSSNMEVLSDDGLISPLPRSDPMISLTNAKAAVTKRPSQPKAAPPPQSPPQQPEMHSTDEDTAEVVPKPRVKKHHSRQAMSPTQSNGRPMPQFKPPPLPPPDMIPEPPSISSSIRSSQMVSMPPPPPPPPPMVLEDMHPGHNVVYTKTTVTTTERSKPPAVRPKPAIKPKPNVVVTERTVVTKTTRRMDNDNDSNDDML